MVRRRRPRLERNPDRRARSDDFLHTPLYFFLHLATLTHSSLVAHHRESGSESLAAKTDSLLFFSTTFDFDSKVVLQSVTSSRAPPRHSRLSSNALAPQQRILQQHDFPKQSTERERPFVPPSSRPAVQVSHRVERTAFSVDRADFSRRSNAVR